MNTTKSSLSSTLGKSAKSQLSTTGGNTPLLIIIICILLTVACVMYAYRRYQQQPQQTIENFDTPSTTTAVYADVVEKLNTMKPLLESIKKAQSINIPFPSEPNVTKYISSQAINDPIVLNEINSSFETNFSQKLQDSEINELSGQLSQLKAKLAASSASAGGNSDSSAIPKLRHISGSVITTFGLAEDTIAGGDSYNMLIGISPSTGDCIKYNPGANRVLDKGVEKMDTLGLTQCNLADNTMKFKTKTINNTRELNAILPENKKIPEYYTMINYPFMLVQPVTAVSSQMCLALNEDGLSVEPCSGNTEQRFQLIQ